MSTPINDGGPAFPRAVSHSDEGGTHRGFTGMTLRDYFAGQAFSKAFELGMDMAKVDRNPDHATSQKIAYYAYDYADAMLAARKEENK
jgi:hypothetical protein